LVTIDFGEIADANLKDYDPQGRLFLSVRNKAHVLLGLRLLQYFQWDKAQEEDAL